jgi:hypothetical protein
MKQPHRSGRWCTSVSLGVGHFEPRAPPDPCARCAAAAWSSRTSRPEPADTRARPNAAVTRRSLWDSLGKPLAKHGQLLYSSLATPTDIPLRALEPLSRSGQARGGPLLGLALFALLGGGTPRVRHGDVQPPSSADVPRPPHLRLPAEGRGRGGLGARRRVRFTGQRSLMFM